MFPPFDESKAKKILAKILNLLEQKKLFLSQVTQESEERKNSAVMLGALVCADENGNEINLVANSGISKQLKFGKSENNEDLKNKSSKNSNEDSGIAKQLKFGKSENNDDLRLGNRKNSNEDSGISKQLKFGKSKADDDLRLRNRKNQNEDSGISKQLKFGKSKAAENLKSGNSKNSNEDFGIAKQLKFGKNFNTETSIEDSGIAKQLRFSESEENDVECYETAKQFGFEKKEEIMDCFARTLSEARNDENGTNCDDEIGDFEKNEVDSEDFDFVIVPPVVSAEKVSEALSKNDAEIHRLTSLRKNAKMMDCFAQTLSADCDDENGTDCDDEVSADCGSKKKRNYIEEINEKLRGLCNESLEKVEVLYDFACADGKIRNLKDICRTRLNGKFPPTGTGDCTAPKLLNYAFSHGLTPVSLAETIFNSENSQKKSKNIEISLVSPCDSRCKIILPEILGLEILYRDDEIVVVNKQSGLLSVPGRGPEKFDSVETRLRRLFPNCIKQPAVHRLDMETSGLMILALTKEAHRKMNQEFENREVKKEYTALLDGILAKKGFQNEGEMELYFRLDVENRPHQIWDRENGKKAVTQWKILDVERYRAPDGTTRNATRVLFIPHTGRTHQLRLASADIHGFGTPIIGDTLYGKCEEGERLLLHASKIEFTHPKTGEKMILESKAPF